MKYLLMIYMNPEIFANLTDEERDGVFAAHDAFQQPLKESGELIGFAALADPSNSTTVRVRDDVLSATDGPYAEAKEFLAGYYAIETDTLERAVELAGQLPDAKLTAIEVRPLMEASGLEM
ncbi:YciI family protein [Hamadaea tsunoensis]|uniref:YciI family protein n=1 Tax=Hamadaea tsunoensis TaxID=53368 RepID=UPI0003F59268|nr:YciI family protein [Hamadaea tsunoensis]